MTCLVTKLEAVALQQFGHDFLINLIKFSDGDDPELTPANGNTVAQF